MKELGPCSHDDSEVSLLQVLPPFCDYLRSCCALLFSVLASLLCCTVLCLHLQEYVRGRKEGWLQKDGNSVKYIAQHGPLAKAIL